MGTEMKIGAEAWFERLKDFGMVDSPIYLGVTVYYSLVVKMGGERLLV